MAPRSKKRMSKIINKLLKLEQLELKDIICTICQSILIEPVTLPCYHNFCSRCFSGSIENNALCCPLCRLRIGSWLRTATKQNSLVNTELWNYIQNKFSEEIDRKHQGEELDLPTDSALPRISEPGEIRLEYEAELRRLRDERLRLEEKQIFETNILIRKLHEEEEEAHKKYLERLKLDETLAKQIQQENDMSSSSKQTEHKNVTDSIKKPKLKPMKIDTYLSKMGTSSTATSNSHTSHSRTSTEISNSNVSPEMVPKYNKLAKSNINKNVRTESNVWNKENGEKDQDCQQKDKKETYTEKSVVQPKNGLHSLLVSLPLPQTRKIEGNRIRKKSVDTVSVDSMHYELCHFKPIDGNTPISFTAKKDLPLQVPSLRLEPEDKSSKNVTAPSRDQYLEQLFNLRKLSFQDKLPSAFAVALSLLRPLENNLSKTNTKLKIKKTCGVSSVVDKVNKNEQSTSAENGKSSQSEHALRRTRSMGSITKHDNEITPKKKVRERKTCSDRKPNLRSTSKKANGKKGSCSPGYAEESINNNKIKLAVKNLSSPLENCDVKCIVQEQLRIEMMIEQEKNDLEFARKMEAEWNGRRQPRRAAHKRQVTLNYALRPAKKLKV